MTWTLVGQIMVLSFWWTLLIIVTAGTLRRPDKAEKL